MSENKPKQAGKRRAPHSAWKPGQSGNPGGRPKELREVAALAREHSAEAIERLAYWMRSDDSRASVAASEKLLDRAWGKAQQAVEVSGPEGAPLQGDVTELRAKVLEALAVLAKGAK
jgi:hypothetical protein